MLPEKLRKMLIYFQNDQTWWLPAMAPEQLTIRLEKIGPYLIDLTGRLDDGHFAVHDASGIPQKDFGGSTGRQYNITRVCGYALANFDRYLHTGEYRWLKPFWACVNWLESYGDDHPEDGFVVRYAYEHKKMPAGRISGMAQGQMLSLFARAQNLNPTDRLAFIAERGLIPFTRPADSGGILATVAETGCNWFEEVPFSQSHILNGHIYSLEGLWDAWQVFNLPQARDLYFEGLDSLEKSLGIFDCGYWSYYDRWDAHRPYIASFSYHLMHCVLLGALAKRHPDRSVLAETAKRWYGYCNSVFCRLRAGMRMALQKYRHIR